RDVEAKMVTFPFWPESQYLVRMANVVPAVVADVIQSIPLNDNYVVLNDFIRAALVMPPELAIKLSNRVIEWVNAHDTLPDPLAGENLGQLILHLANGGEITAALELAKSVLAKTRGSSGWASWTRSRAAAGRRS